MNNRLDAAIESLMPLAVGTSAPAVRLAGILAALQSGDTDGALRQIRDFGDAAERNGVAGRLAPLLGRLLDAHGLALLC
jgi:hypothetical protein